MGHLLNALQAMDRFDVIHDIRKLIGEKNLMLNSYTVRKSWKLDKKFILESMVLLSFK